MQDKTRIFIKVWRFPIVIAILSIFGLLSALLGDHFWDVVSWVSLSIPVVLMIWFLWTGRSNVPK